MLHISVRADTGGGPQHMWLLFSGFSNSEVEVFVACPKEEPYWKRFGTCSGVKGMVEIPHRAFSLSALYRLIRFVKEHKIEIVHSHGKGAGLYSRVIGLLAGVKVVHTMHGVHIGDYSWLTAKIYCAFERLMGFFTSAVIAVSKAEERDMLVSGVAGRGNITVITNGILPAEKLNASIGSSIEKAIIINVNRFNRQKNPALLIPICQALVKNLSIPFVIKVLGHGEQMESFQEDVKSAGLGEYFAFSGSVADPFSHYVQAHLFLSTALWEGLPLAPMEAMSCGIPVVMTDVTGNDEIVEHGVNGFLYPVDSPAEGAQSIVTLIEDDELRARIARAAVETVHSKYSCDAMVSSTLAVYKVAVERSKR